MGKKLTVYLIDGNDNGPRTIEIGNWSGKAIFSPRASLINLMNRPEFDKPGIYVLKSDPTEDAYDEKIYIGEAEKVGQRLKQHINNPDKDFKECIFFTSKDELLTKSHIKYIESRLVNLAFEAKNSQIDNGNIPTESSLSEADVSDMEYFIDQIKLILPVAGFTFLISSTVTKDSKYRIDKDKITSEIYYINSKGIQAKMIESSEGFIILQDSQAFRETSKSMMKSWVKLRKKFIDTGILIENNDNYIFKEDTIFSSLSAAASIVMGRQVAGTIEWKDKSGKSYKEINESIIFGQNGK